jgi:hypothetical protein
MDRAHRAAPASLERLPGARPQRCQEPQALRPLADRGGGDLDSFGGDRGGGKLAATRSEPVEVSNRPTKHRRGYFAIVTGAWKMCNKPLS